MKLDRHLFRPGDLQDAGRPVAVVRDLRVRIVVRQNEIVSAGELHRLPEELRRGSGAGWIVWIVQEQDLRFACHIGRNCRKIREKSPVAQQRHRMRNPLRQNGR